MEVASKSPRTGCGPSLLHLCFAIAWPADERKRARQSWPARRAHGHPAPPGGGAAVALGSPHPARARAQGRCLPRGPSAGTTSWAQGSGEGARRATATLMPWTEAKPMTSMRLGATWAAWAALARRQMAALTCRRRTVPLAKVPVHLRPLSPTHTCPQGRKRSMHLPAHPGPRYSKGPCPAIHKSRSNASCASMSGPRTKAAPRAETRPNHAPT